MLYSDRKNKLCLVVLQKHHYSWQEVGFLLTVLAQKPKPKCSSRLNCTLALEVLPLEKLRDVCQTVLAAQISLLY